MTAEDASSGATCLMMSPGLSCNWRRRRGRPQSIGAALPVVGGEAENISMMPQMAWKYRQDRERAMKTIRGELPRYADYADRDNSTMERRDPWADFRDEELPADLRSRSGAGQQEYCPTSVPKGQVLSRSKEPRRRSEERPQDQEVSKPRKGWKWCKHCGCDGAKVWRDPSKPPVDTIPMEEGYILVQPKPGVSFLSDHASQDCPKYKDGAMYLCSKCSRHDRIAFHYPDKCQEDFSGRPAVSSSFAARRSAFFSFYYSNRPLLMLDLSTERNTFVLRNHFMKWIPRLKSRV